MVGEILPKAPDGYGLLEIYVGGCHNAHVRRYRFPPAYSLKKNKP
jgi:hypothetical protein